MKGRSKSKENAIRALYRSTLLSPYVHVRPSKFYALRYQNGIAFIHTLRVQVAREMMVHQDPKRMRASSSLAYTYRLWI